MVPNLRNHSGLLLSCLATAIGFGALVIGCQAFVKTESTTTPGKRITEEQLQGEVALKKADFQGRAADLAAEYQKLQNQVTAYNVQAQAASADLQKRQADVANVVNVLGGVFAKAAQGAFDPLSLLTTIPTLALGALGLGSMVDKSNLQTALNNTRLLYTSPPTSSPSPDTSTPAPALATEQSASPQNAAAPAPGSVPIAPIVLPAPAFLGSGRAAA